MKKNFPNKLTIVIKKGDKWWIAHVKEFPGCASQGKTMFSAMKHIREAAMLWWESIDRYPL